jgi:site-specific recombinase XerD
VVRGTFGKRITSCPFQRIVQRIYKESEVYRNGLTIHSLRHTYAENLRKKKVDLKVIKTLLGHSSLATTDRYLHVSSEDLKEAAI